MYLERRQITKANAEFENIERLVTEILSRSESTDSNEYVRVVNNAARVLEARKNLVAGMSGEALKVIEEVEAAMSYATNDAETRILYDTYMVKGDACLSERSLIAAADAYEEAASLQFDSGEAAMKAARVRTLTGRTQFGRAFTGDDRGRFKQRGNLVPGR